MSLWISAWAATGPLLLAAAWIHHRRRPPLPQRTPTDVRADVDKCRAARIAETNARLGRVPAAPDNTQGLRLDWADHCELIWSAPFDPQTGLELLRRDIRKQQREEES